MIHNYQDSFCHDVLKYYIFSSRLPQGTVTWLSSSRWRLHFQVSFNFWVILKGREHSLHAAWNMDMWNVSTMATASAAIPNHAVEATYWRWCNKRLGFWRRNPPYRLYMSFLWERNKHFPYSGHCSLLLLLSLFVKPKLTGICNQS